MLCFYLKSKTPLTLIKQRDLHRNNFRNTKNVLFNHALTTLIFFFRISYPTPCFSYESMKGPMHKSAMLVKGDSGKRRHFHLARFYWNRRVIPQKRCSVRSFVGIGIKSHMTNFYAQFKTYVIALASLCTSPFNKHNLL